MKNLLIVSVFIALVLNVNSAVAATQYVSDNETDSSIQALYNEQVSESRTSWDETIRSYEANYNDSMKKYWDEYTAAYQKQKKIQH